MSSLALFVQVILDVPLLPPLTYKLEQNQEVQVGDRCVVPLGKREVVGIVVGKSDHCEVDPKKPVSYTHLTLPTNSRV